MKGKKMLLMCLSILMVLGMVGGFKLTANAMTSGDYYYMSDEDSVTITGYKGKKSSITIPSEIEGKKVSEIDERAFSKCNSLKSVTIPDSVVYIYDKAFYSCENLTTVVIGNNVKSIGERVFTGCEKLKKVTIPNSVKSIGSQAFFNCVNLEKIVLPNDLKVMNKGLFLQCENLKSITIPNSVEKIEEEVFYVDNNLKCVNYNGTIAQWKKIKIDATNNEYLKKVTIYCTDGKIEYVKPTNFGYGIVGRQFIKLVWDKISNATGYEIQLATDKKFTQNKRTITIAKQNQTMMIAKNLKANQKYYMRGRVYKSQIVNKKTINSYSDWSEVKAIKLVTKKSNDKVSGNYEYSVNKNNTATITAYMGSGTKLTIPSKLGGKKVTKIGYRTFEGRDFKSVKIANTVTEIGEGAFWCCAELKSGSRPKGGKKIGEDAFLGCEELKKVTLPNTVIEIGKCAFASCGRLETINIPKGVKKISNGIFNECVKLKKITIPEKVTEIGNTAFAGCYNLKALNIPQKVKKIGSHAFYGCGFKSITIPDGVKEIPYGMLTNCQSLKEVVLPDSITKIGDWAFYFTKIKNIKISKNVKEIGECAFSTCNSLASVQYTGTKKQWKSVKIGDENTDLKSAMIYCKDGTINNKGVTVKNVAKAKKAVKVSWSKVSSVNGYKVQVATNSKFTKNVKTVLISTQKTTSVTVKGLKSNQKYYVRMCTYKVKKVAENASVKLYYPWSKTKSVTTK